MAKIIDRSDKKNIDPQLMQDLRRYREKLKKACRDRAYEIIAETPILKTDGKKIIKTTIKALKEYQFAYQDDGEGGQLAAGDNGENGQADTLPKANTGAGNMPGIDHLEQDLSLTMEEIIEMALEDLHLLDFWRSLKKRNLQKILRTGKSRSGPAARLHKRETAKQMIARTRAQSKRESGGAGFEKSDRRYTNLQETQRPEPRAIFFCLIDVSGSMDDEKKTLTRIFYFLLVQYLKKYYADVKTVFICHDAEAREKPEEEALKTGSSGGTRMSSPYRLILDIMRSRFPNEGNFYVIHVTDGENLPADEPELIQFLTAVSQKTRLTAIVETMPTFNSISASDGIRELERKFKNFLMLTARQKHEIKEAIRRIINRASSAVKL